MEVGMSQRARLGVIAAAVVVAIAGFVIASSGGDSKKSKGSASIVVKGGKPVGGVREISVNKGDPVRFSVTSDVADEVHVHGYDFHKDVAKGGSVSFSFKARIDGVFVIELERRAEQIASLKVQP
jgi:plastocyanin